jgi:hypothetical protein
MLDRVRIRALREAGHTLAEIAATVGVGKRSVQRILRAPPIQRPESAPTPKSRQVGRPSKVELSFRPNSCPNLLNPRSRGRITAAIPGSDSFDVSVMDVASIVLTRDGSDGRVLPVSSRIDDVTTPAADDGCACDGPRGPDGWDDLVLHFATAERVDALDLASEPGGESVSLTVSGQFTVEVGGRPFSATDCIRLVPRAGKQGS